MAKRGRKRKPGNRTPSGQLSRAKPKQVTFDKGSDRTQDKFSVYGPDGADAIGRAYVKDLLGDNGLELRNLARKIHRAYWPMLAVGREKSCLGLDINGQAVNDNLLDPEEREYKIKREKRLTDTLRTVERMSRQHRKAFDDLCIEINPDTGPAWLDKLIWAKQHGKTPDRADAQALERAIEALKAVANEWG